MAQVICLVISEMRSDSPTSVSTGWRFNADAKINYSEESSHHYEHRRSGTIEHPNKKGGTKGRSLR
jgi:hypothetical protein